MPRPMSHHLDYFEVVSHDYMPKADFHLHTNWTDGEHSVEEMYSRAVDLGLECVLFSEHGRESSVDWFPAFADEVRALERRSCTALVGLETKVVDFEGNLDTTQAIVRECDFPLTGTGCVSLIVTDIAVLVITPEGLVLKETAPGWTPEEIQAETEPTLVMSPDLQEIVL